LDPLGSVPIDTIDPLAYAVPEKPRDHTEQEKALLRPPADNIGGKTLRDIDVGELSFFKTEKWGGPGNVAIKSTQAKVKDGSALLETMTPAERIEYGFRKQHPSSIPEHPSNKNLRAHSVITVLPFECEEGINDGEFAYIFGDRGLSVSGMVLNGDISGGSLNAYCKDMKGQEESQFLFSSQYKCEVLALPPDGDYFLMIDVEDEMAKLCSISDRLRCKKKAKISVTGESKSIPSAIILE